VTRRAAGARQLIAPVVARLERGEAWLVAVTRRFRVSPPGLVTGTLFLCMSLTPSLLPRTWLAQGLISGFSTAAGYGIGVSLHWLWLSLYPVARSARRRVRRLPTNGPVEQATVHAAEAAMDGFIEGLEAIDDAIDAIERRPRVRVWTGRVLTAVCLVLMGLSLHAGSLSQIELAHLMGEPAPDRPAYLLVLAVGAAVLVGVVVAVRALRAALGWIVGWPRRRVPPGPAQPTAVALTLILVLLLAQNVVVRGLVSTASAISEQVNDSLSSAPIAPTSADRSGSPQSQVLWSTLGREGRLFVTGGPSTASISRFAGGGPVQAPVRVYVGLQSAATLTAEADLAVRELDRTGGFSRAVLCVVTTTGTGWVDPYLSAALEYMYRGNTAVVGMQYSYLPSGISFITERQRVAMAGRALFDRVYARWAALPSGHRPRLLVFGESLGSLGSEAAFSGLDDVRARSDGVLWAGPTSANPLWRSLVGHRDPGTTQVLPQYHRGAQVRWVSSVADLTRPSGVWQRPRVVYLQNPSDPVTWWSPKLLIRKPDWLREPRGHDVLPTMRWYPVVTFLQVTADLGLAYGAPPGHGHRFHTAAVWAWAAIAAPDNWTDAKSRALTALLGP
jgi:uncharacterized membrane protein